MANERFIGREGEWINDSKQKVKLILSKAKAAAASVLDGLDRSPTADIRREVAKAQARAVGSEGIVADFQNTLEAYSNQFSRRVEDAYNDLNRLKKRPPESNASAQMKSQSWWPAHYKKVVDEWQEEIDFIQNVQIPDMQSAASHIRDQQDKIEDTFQKQVSHNIQSIPYTINPDYDKIEEAIERTSYTEGQNLGMSSKLEENMPPKIQHTMLGMYDSDDDDPILSQSELIKNERLARGVQVGDFLPGATGGSGKETYVTEEGLPNWDNLWSTFYGPDGMYQDTTYQNPPPPYGLDVEGDMNWDDVLGESLPYNDPFKNGSGNDKDSPLEKMIRDSLPPPFSKPGWWPDEYKSSGKFAGIDVWWPIKTVKDISGELVVVFDWSVFNNISKQYNVNHTSEEVREAELQYKAEEQEHLANKKQAREDAAELEKYGGAGGELEYRQRIKEAELQAEQKYKSTVGWEDTPIPGTDMTLPAKVTRGFGGNIENIEELDFPSIDRQIDQAILSGDMSRARQLTSIRNMPSPENKLNLMLQIANSPADVFQLSNMAAGNGLQRFGELAPAMRQAAMGILSDPFEQAMAAQKMQQEGQPGVPQFAAEVEEEPIPQQAPSPTPSAQGPTYGGTELQPGTVYRQDASGNIVPDIFSEYGGQDPEQNLSQQSPMNMFQGSGSYNTGTNLSGGKSQEWTDPRFNPRQFFNDLLPTTTYGLQQMDHRIHIDPKTGQPRHEPLSSFEGSALGFERPQSRDNFIQAYNALLQNGVSPIDAARSLGMDDEQLSAFTRPDTQQVSGSPGNPFATGFGSGVGGMGDNSMIFPSGMTNLMSGKAPNLNPSSLLGSAGLPIPSMQQWGAFLPEERDVFKRYSQMQGLPEGVVDREIKSHTPGQKQRTSAARLGTNLGKY